MGNLPDPEIEELKELVEKDLKLTAETNQMVHEMRRSARWGLFFQMLYWLLILGIAGAAYYYVSPYIEQVFGVYQSIQEGGAQSKNILENLQQALGQLVPPHSTGTSTGQ